MSSSGDSPLSTTAASIPSTTAMAAECSMMVLWMKVRNPPEMRIGTVSRTAFSTGSSLIDRVRVRVMVRVQ